MQRLPLMRIFGFDKFSGLYLWAIFIVVFAIWTPSLFLTRVTLYSTADGQAVAAMIGIAICLPLAAGAYDLSVGAVAGFSAIVVTTMQDNQHWGVWPSIALAVGLSIVIGAVNGFIVVVLKVNSFIATLGTASVIGAFQVIVAGSNQPLPPISATWTNLTQHKIGGFQIIVLYLLVLALILWWVLEKTQVGRYLYAIGGNTEAARLAGVNVGGWTWTALIASGGICGIAGVLYASQNGPSLTFGPALLLPAFSAAFLGSTQLKPGRVNIWGTLIAVYVLATGVKGLQLVTGVQWLGDMFNGTALIAAVAFAIWGQQHTGRRARLTSETDADNVETPAAGPDLTSLHADLGAEPADRSETAPATGLIDRHEEH
jgi:ribose transport system permease protein